MNRWPKELERLLGTHGQLKLWDELARESVRPKQPKLPKRDLIGNCMRAIFVLLLLFLLQTAEPPRHQLDLEPLLKDPVALQKLRIMYQLPSHKVYQGLATDDRGGVREAGDSRQCAANVSRSRKIHQG